MNLRENTNYIKVVFLNGYSIPKRWKFNHQNATNFIIHDPHLIKGSRVITLDKVTSTEIYSILISKVQNKPSNIFLIYLINATLTGQ